MRTIAVTFYKEIFHGMSEKTSYEKVEFKFEMCSNKSDYENMADAYDIAVGLGHNPTKNIMIKEI